MIRGLKYVIYRKIMKKLFPQFLEGKTEEGFYCGFQQQEENRRQIKCKSDKVQQKRFWLDIREMYLQWVCLNTRTGYSESLWNPYSSRYSKWEWIQPQAVLTWEWYLPLQSSFFWGIWINLSQHLRLGFFCFLFLFWREVCLFVCFDLLCLVWIFWAFFFFNFLFCDFKWFLYLKNFASPAFHYTWANWYISWQRNFIWWIL